MDKSKLALSFFIPDFRQLGEVHLDKLSMTEKQKSDNKM